MKTMTLNRLTLKNLMTALAWVSFQLGGLVLPDRALASDEGRMNLVDVFALPSSPSVSCSILQARRRFRQKTYRELSHATIEWTDYLLTNKLFRETEIWRDKTIRVTVTAEIPVELREHVQTQGLTGLKFKILGKGVVWSARTEQVPEDFEIDLTESSEGIPLFQVSYPIYMAELCEEGVLDPELKLSFD